jgi:hypothetical protein
MKKSLCALSAGFVLLFSQARAEDVNLKETADTTYGSSLAPYSLGIGGGVITALNDELKAKSDAFLKLSVIQSITFQEHWNLGLDLDWYLPGQNWGTNLNVDYAIGTQAFKPFVGVGGGFNYFDKAGDFGSNIGASGNAHFGLLLDVLDELQLRVRVPFLIVANKAGDRGLGLDVGLLFSSPLRTTKVKKLRY